MSIAALEFAPWQTSPLPPVSLCMREVTAAVSAAATADCMVTSAWLHTAESANVHYPHGPNAAS